MKIFLSWAIFILSVSTAGAQHWQEAFTQAQSAFDQGDYSKAGELSLKALEVAYERHGEYSNESINTLQLLIDCNTEGGNLASAIDYSSKLLKSLEKAVSTEHPLYAQAAVYHGTLLIESGDNKEALKFYTINKNTIDSQLSQEGDYGYFLADLAFLYQTEGDEENAIKQYKGAILALEESDIDPKFLFSNLVILKDLLRKHERRDDLIIYGRKILHYDDPGILAATATDLADTYQKVENYDSATYFLLYSKAVYDQGSIKKDDQYSYVLNQLAYISSLAGDNVASTAYLVDNQDVQDKTFLLNQAVIAQNNGDLKGASKFYDKLFALDADSKLENKEKLLFYDYYTIYNIRLNNYENASSFNKKVLEIGKKEYGTKSIDYLALLSHQALVERSFGNYGKAREIYTQLSGEIKKHGLSSTKLNVEVLSNFAITMQSLNEYIKAKALFEESVEVALAINYPQDNLAVLYNNYAVILQLAGDYGYAEETQLKSLTLIKESYGDKHPNYAHNLINLGEIYLKQGNFIRSDSVFGAAKKLTGEIYGKNSPEYANALISATKVDKELGRYAKADQSYIEALDLLRQSGGAYEIDLSFALNDYGLLLQKFGNYKLAERNFSQAAEIFRKMFGEVNAEYASSLGNLANLYQMQEKDTEAEKYLKEVMKIDEQLHGKLHPKYSTTLHNLASLYQKQEKTEEAIALFSTALEIDSLIFGTAHHSYANTLYNLADLYDTKGEYNKALLMYKRVLTIMGDIYGVDNPEYIYRLYGTARLHQRLRNNEAAIQMYRTIVKSYLYQINEYFPVLSEDQKGLFYAKVSPVFNSYRELLINMVKENPAFGGELLNLQLNTKAVLLKASNRLRNEIANSTDSSVKNLYQELVDNKNRLLNFYNYSKSDLAAEGVDLQQLENRVNLQEKELSIKLKLFSEVFGEKEASWEMIKQSLQDDEVVVEIVRIEEAMQANKVTYAALVLNNEMELPEVVIFENGAELEGAAYKFYRNSLAFDITDDRSFSKFWEPFHSFIQGYARVYIAPDGIYNKLSFNTLFNTGTGRYIIDDQMISLISSAKDLLKRHTSEALSSRSASLFGFPIFNTDKTVITSTANVNRLYEEWMTDIDLLPGTRTEVNNIDLTLRQNDWTVVKNIEAEASEQNIKNLKGPTVLHIATHGYFSEDISYDINDWKDQESTDEYDFNPLVRSGLLLSQAEMTVRKRLAGSAVNTENDGILTAYEAMNLNLTGTDLVVLSACETGLGEVRNGEGVYGLQRAFLVSGAKNLIMSLWKVNDEATQELMSVFYSKWSKTGNLPTALREAQLEIKEKYKSPSLWGGFILNGL